MPSERHTYVHACVCVVQVRLPSEICSSVSMHDKVSYESKEALYSPKRLSSDLAALYTTHVENALDTHEVASGGTRIGACLLEPGMQGAGGMIMLDPLFQKILAQVCACVLAGACYSLT